MRYGHASGKPLAREEWHALTIADNESLLLIILNEGKPSRAYAQVCNEQFTKNPRVHADRPPCVTGV